MSNITKPEEREDKYEVEIESFGKKRNIKAIVLFSAIAVGLIVGIVLFITLTNGANDPTISIGEIIEFGGHDWRVLDIQDGKALILSDLLLESRAYNERYTNMTWENSDIRSYLNGEFYYSFNESDRARLFETEVVNNDNYEYRTRGGNNTTDKIFLLSIDEVNKYFDNDCRISYNRQGNASWWWLRSPGSLSKRAAIVLSDGDVYYSGNRIFRDNGGIRPAMWLNLES